MESYNNNLLTKLHGSRYAHTLRNIFCPAYVGSFILFFLALFFFFPCNRNVPTMAVVHCYEPSCVPWKPARIIRDVIKLGAIGNT